MAFQLKNNEVRQITYKNSSGKIIGIVTENKSQNTFFLYDADGKLLRKAKNPNVFNDIFNTESKPDITAMEVVSLF